MTKATKNKLLDYCEIYEKEVLPIFKEMEPVRLDLLNKFNKETIKICCLIIITPIILGTICFLLSNNGTDIHAISYGIYLFSLGILPVTTLFSIILYGSERKKENQKFIHIMKIKALKPLLKVFGNIEWCKETGNNLLTDEELNPSGLFLSYNARNTDDEFKGTYKGVPFKISETTLHDVGKRYAIRVFKGIIISFKFNKTINNRTIVSTKGDFTKKNQTWFTMLAVTLGCLVEFFKNGFSYGNLAITIIVIILAFVIAKKREKQEEALDRVSLEDPKFSKKFDVYSSDQVEARYLLTPSFMNRFYNLKTVFGAKKAKCSFYGDTLMIAINTNKNLFEIGSLYKSLLAPTSINEFYRELDSIYKMIEYFKLDENIGL